MLNEVFKKELVLQLCDGLHINHNNKTPIGVLYELLGLVSYAQGPNLWSRKGGEEPKMWLKLRNRARITLVPEGHKSPTSVSNKILVRYHKE